MKLLLRQGSELPFAGFTQGIAHEGASHGEQRSHNEPASLQLLHRVLGTCGFVSAVPVCPQVPQRAMIRGEGALVEADAEDCGTSRCEPELLHQRFYHVS